MSKRGAFILLAVVLVLAAAAVMMSAPVYNNQVEQARLAAFRATPATPAPTAGDAERGQAVARAAGCIACHTDSENGGALLGGGVHLQTPFGTFVSPNITSDRTAGVGTWTVDMLAAALLNGRRPDGEHYWPAFPYPAYAALHRQDIVDLHAWLQSTEPVALAAAEHELSIPDAFRAVLGIWKVLYVPDDYEPGRFVDRGEYLVKGPGHCAACHAPRDLMGGVPDRRLTGNSRGPDGVQVPAIHAGALQSWTVEDIAFFLEIGMTPEGDFSGGHMAEVIEQGTGHLSSADRRAMAEFLKSPANRGRVE